MCASDPTGSLFRGSGSARGIAAADVHHADGDGLLARLLRLAESLLAQGAGAIDALCTEVEALTRGGARLRLRYKQAGGEGGRVHGQLLPHGSGPFRSRSVAACTAHS